MCGFGLGKNSIGLGEMIFRAPVVVIDFDQHCSQYACPGRAFQPWPNLVLNIMFPHKSDIVPQGTS